MAFVRFDIQVTEEEGVAIAHALRPILGGFGDAYKRMMDVGANDGKHMTMLYRSRPVQDELDRQDQSPGSGQ